MLSSAGSPPCPSPYVGWARPLTAAATFVTAASNPKLEPAVAAAGCPAAASGDGAAAPPPTPRRPREVWSDEAMAAISAGVKRSTLDSTCSTGPSRGSEPLSKKLMTAARRYCKRHRKAKVRQYHGSYTGAYVIITCSSSNSQGCPSIRSSQQ